MSGTVAYSNVDTRRDLASGTVSLSVKTKARGKSPANSGECPRQRASGCEQLGGDSG
jgi:hypothetical protein